MVLLMYYLFYILVISLFDVCICRLKVIAASSNTYDSKNDVTLATLLSVTSTTHCNVFIKSVHNQTIAVPARQLCQQSKLFDRLCGDLDEQNELNIDKCCNSFNHLIQCLQICHQINCMY